jgi:PQQ-like domain
VTGEAGGGPGGPTGAGVPPEPRRSAVQYPGGLSARYRWTGSGGIGALTAMSEVGGELIDHGPLVSDAPDRLCRAELRVEGPTATWTARFASPIHDDPAGLLWDTEGLLVVKYGFEVYALVARTGELRWHHESRTPVVAVLGSSRLTHVIVQTEIETVALAGDGAPVWRAAHSDVVAEVDLVGGRLVLTSYAGLLQTLDPVTGRQLDR